ncbi:MAG: ABC transporter substrate-binding protein [Acidimicrobiia bacterium]
MNRMHRLMAMLAVLALVLAACGGSTGNETTTTAAGGGDQGGTSFTDVDVSGTEVSVWGAPTGDEGQSIQNTFDVYGQAEDATVTWLGSDSFEQDLRIAVDGGSPPDMAILPQPGSICEFADKGNLVSLEDMGFDIAEMEAAHSAYIIGLGQCADGNHYAIPTNVNYKSIIWYNKPAFEAAGYEIPTTWDELVALSQTIADSGTTPWCIGLGSEAATGWPGTDWIEDIMVRTAGADVYNQWVNHEIPFNDPAVKTAFDTAAEIWFADGFVLGGIDGVSAIDFRDAPDPMFNDPPSCLLHRQASFIANFFPEGVVPGTDADFFDFPAIDTSLPAAAMGGGELAIVFNNRPEVVAFLDAYAGPDLQCVQASPTGDGTNGNGTADLAAPIERISANANTPNDCYESDTVKKQAAAVATALGANGFVFDASDLMPSEVGQGSFWTGMVDWTRGTPTQEVLDTIEASWPSS